MQVKGDEWDSEAGIAKQGVADAGARGKRAARGSLQKQGKVWQGSPVCGGNGAGALTSVWRVLQVVGRLAGFQACHPAVCLRAQGALPQEGRNSGHCNSEK